MLLGFAYHLEFPKTFLAKFSMAIKNLNVFKKPVMFQLKLGQNIATLGKKMTKLKTLILLNKINYYREILNFY